MCGSVDCSILVQAKSITSGEHVFLGRIRSHASVPVCYEKLFIPFGITFKFSMAFIVLTAVQTSFFSHFHMAYRLPL